MATFIDPTEPIAIIGLGGVFPGAKDIPAFWKNIINKVDSITEVPKDRWDWRLYYDADMSAPDKTYSKIGGFVTDFEFDPLKLRIPPPVANQMDGPHKLAIGSTAMALEDAGYAQKPFDRARTAVIFGNSMGGAKKEASDLRVYTAVFRDKLLHAPSLAHMPKSAREAIAVETVAAIKAGLTTINEDTMPGELSNVIAGRVANVFNLNGPNFTVDAACASSLGALAQAVNGLRFRQFDMVVTGGVDQMMAAPAYVKFSKIGALSPDGSRPFDADANGFVMGEGCGVLILKRLTDAVKDGDRIYALIRSIGASSDGKGKGITAPNPKGQKFAIERAFETLNYRPEDVGLLEAHGTSTRVGDLSEVQAASEVFKDAAPGSIALGSIKSQIGHLKAAAGAAGLVKAALAIFHKTLPPSINYRKPNPGVDWSKCPFYVNTEPRPWDSQGKVRRANVSAFGFGGTNFHVTLEEATEQTRSWTPALHAVSQQALDAAAAGRTPELPAALGGETFCFGGGDPDSVKNRLSALAKDIVPGPLTRLAYQTNLAFQASGGEYVLSLAAESGDRLREKIALVLGAKTPVWEKTPPSFKPKSLFVGRRAAQRPKIAFLFPGQGAQYVDMLKDLGQKYQVVADTFAEADKIMTELVGEKLTDVLFTKGGESEETLRAMQERIKQTEITQPAVLTADVAILRLLAQFGVEPDVVAGHSLGEYGALVASGVLSFRQALTAVSARAKEMSGLKIDDNGRMASVAAPVDRIEAILKKVDGYVIVANKNCPSQSVIAGASQAVEDAVKLCQAEGIQCQFIEVSHAFHSSIVAPATEAYAAFFSRIKPKAPQIPVLSNVTADYYPADEKDVRDLVTRQIASPVQWIRQIERMYADGIRVFVEVGPKRALSAFVTSTLEDKKDVIVSSSNHPKRGGIHEINDLLARLSAAGVAVDYSVTDLASGGSLYTQGYRNWASQGTAPAAPMGAPSPQAKAVLRADTSSEQSLMDRWDLYLGPVMISGVSAGVPGTWDRLFRESALDDVLAGKNLIEPLPEKALHDQLEKNLERVVKSETGDHRFERMENIAQVIRLAGQAGKFDMSEEFGIRSSITSLMDNSGKMVLAAAILALKDAGIPLVRHYKKTTTGSFIPTGWGIPEPLQAETGLIMASAFPGVDSLVDDVSRFFTHKYSGKPAAKVAELYDRMISTLKDPADRKALTDWYFEFRKENPVSADPESTYKFSRSFLFRVLSLGHAQTSQYIKAMGPCTQINAACASTTQAVGMAEDWIRTGRAKRVIVVAADDISNPTLMGWMGTGFLATGASSTKDVVSEAALPFDRRRSGMIIGMGAVGMVIEDGRQTAARGMKPLAEILATQFENSAFHMTRLQQDHVSATMNRLMAKAERRHGISRKEIAAKMLFMSHETYTPAQGGSASAEVEALKATFGPETARITVTNTKGFTGHSMGASIEDAIAVRAMYVGKLPPIANYQEPDPDLAGITLSQGGDYDIEYALRLGAGFGSQIAMTLLKRTCKAPEPRVSDPGRNAQWLREVSGMPDPVLEVVQNTLRIKDAGKPTSVSVRPGKTAPAAKPAAAVKPAAAPVPVTAMAPAEAAPSAKGETARSGDGGPMAADITKAIVALVSEKTGYPADMLELDLDMEADLGIDTVKQAELIGLIRDKYGIAKTENLSLKDYPTL
ncbi:MAG TPA: beta-ketoacyl synthase, partial [Elusimicrobia bacterium]|nr:beta-ketoacyl synthase [Elusimicrobiota bacterium]